ncbi:MAG: single-stranded-DNA-specific exonuclease RecJ [Planctomycetota bacterium]
MPLRWSVQRHDTELVQSIEKTCKVSPVVAQILAVRGLTHPKQVDSFFDLKMTGLHGPFELPGVQQAVETIDAAIKSGKKIIVYGDYDCDGMTSTAILYRCIGLIGGNVSYFVPSRLDDGYGVSKDALKRLKDRGAELIVTVDCGILSIPEAEYAKSIGLELVITDHHVPGQILPNANAIVHPALPDADYPFKDLCGAGIAFKLAWALCQNHHGSEKLPEKLRSYLFWAISLAAIGTVADVVPLLSENRIIVNHGLNLLPSFANTGLRHLLRLAQLDIKPKLDAEDIAFMIGPRLNAAGRLGQAQLGVELLTIQEDDRAQALAEYIDQLNKSRDSLDRSILRAANKQLKDDFDISIEPGLVLASPDWHVGVIGIVAGRLVEKHHRPTILISIDKLGQKPATGSARSIPGIDILKAIAGCKEHVIKFGGHRAAAGLSIEPDKIDEFREAFCHQITLQSNTQELIPELDIDAEARLSQLTIHTLNELEKLAPFGQGNPRPVMCASRVQLARQPKTMGKEDRHLDLQLMQQDVKIRAVGFGKGEWVTDLADDNGQFDFAFKPVINDFNGRRKVELHLIDYRRSDD